MESLDLGNPRVDLKPLKLYATYCRADRGRSRIVIHFISLNIKSSREAMARDGAEKIGLQMLLKGCIFLIVGSFIVVWG